MIIIYNRIKPEPGQESVWDYPRPPRLEDVEAQIQIIFNNRIIVDTLKAKRVLETSHPPVYYIPREDIKMKYLFKAKGRSICEWKGAAEYYSIKVDKKHSENIAWYYSNPNPDFEPIKNYLAFYAASMDSCTVDGERVIPQPGGFYGGWITKNIVGPFKGEPGTMWW
jgi:uncharacterized protein (DUF427 family)